MRRLAPFLALSLLLVPASADAAAATSTVSVERCDSAPQAIDRTTTFEVKMSGVRRSWRMQVRFSLYERVVADGTVWRRLKAPGFDTWQTSAYGVGRYSFSRTVKNLQEPALYRTAVAMRWLDRSGEVIRTERKLSKTCSLRSGLARIQPRNGPIRRGASDTLKV